MKPRIRKSRGVWVCSGAVRIDLDDGFTFDWLVGHGYTPAQAWQDWKTQIQERGIE